MVTKTGYEDWNRTLNLEAGTLTWLDYIRLVPKSRTPQTVANYSSLVSMKASPDLRSLLVQERADVPTFQLVDLRSEQIRSTSLTLPANAYSEAGIPGVAHTFVIDRWNNGGRYALVKHMYRDQVEWLVVDTENVDQTINITSVLSVGFKDVRFAGTNGRTLYGLTNDGVVRKIDLSNATLSRALITNVDSFDMYETSILSYVGTDPADSTVRVAGVFRDGDENAHILRRVDSLDIVVKIAVGRYFGDDYVAIAEGSEVSILKGDYPTSSSEEATSLKDFATLELPAAVTHLTLSPDSDYVVAQAGTAFMSYEIEHRRLTAGSITAAEGIAATPLRWLDNAQIWNDDAGLLMMRDFDGSNAYAIMPVASGFDATLSQNGRFFYSIGVAENGFSLQRVKMILE
jgi:hypothetical protein